MYIQPHRTWCSAYWKFHVDSDPYWIFAFFSQQRNLNCKKETVSSIFQAYGAQDYSNAIKHDQELDNAIVTFNQMEKHAEQQSFRTYKVM